MPALAKVDDDAFVRTFSTLDRAIVNPVFLLSSFLGAPVLTAAALVAAWDDDACPWVAGALGLHLVMVGITAAVHLPRNDALKATADLPAASLSVARADFDERVWVRWNLVRVLVSTGALVLLTISLTVAA
jgi:uncharacterized membrane protein